MVWREGEAARSPLLNVQTWGIGPRPDCVSQTETGRKAPGFRDRTRSPMSGSVGFGKGSSFLAARLGSAGSPDVEDAAGGRWLSWVLSFAALVARHAPPEAVVPKRPPGERCIRLEATRSHGPKLECSVDGWDDSPMPHKHMVAGRGVLSVVVEEHGIAVLIERKAKFPLLVGNCRGKGNVWTYRRVIVGAAQEVLEFPDIFL
ncbi:hypothetical protein LY76DRAFT_603503 [Colletotrichum caudatum]|nr:hypothetical protein LY76DRAFT_603503 [Colletotrichum caudatum]